MNANFDFARQAQDMLRAANDVRIPENLQAFAEESVAKTREAYVKLAAVTKDGAKAAEDVILTAQAGAKSLGEKVLSNTLSNTEAALDAASELARARTLPDAARIQAEFLRRQLETASHQTRELFELSAKVAKATLETMNTATTSAVEKVRKSV